MAHKSCWKISLVCFLSILDVSAACTEEDLAVGDDCGDLSDLSSSLLQVNLAMIRESADTDNEKMREASQDEEHDGVSLLTVKAAPTDAEEMAETGGSPSKEMAETGGSPSEDGGEHDGPTDAEEMADTGASSSQSDDKDPVSSLVDGSGEGANHNENEDASILEEGAAHQAAGKNEQEIGAKGTGQGLVNPTNEEEMRDTGAWVEKTKMAFSWNGLPASIQGDHPKDTLTVPVEV